MEQSRTVNKIVRSVLNSDALRDAKERYGIDVSVTTVSTAPTVTDPVVVYYTGDRVAATPIRTPRRHRKRHKKHKKRHFIVLCIDNGP